MIAFEPPQPPGATRVLQHQPLQFAHEGLAVMTQGFFVLNPTRAIATVKVTYQACNADQCLEPETRTADFAFSIRE